jgi:hypothetical protein
VFVEGWEEERTREARELLDGVGADLALISNPISPTLVTSIQQVFRSVRLLSSELDPTGFQRLPLDLRLRLSQRPKGASPAPVHTACCALTRSTVRSNKQVIN